MTTAIPKKISNEVAGGIAELYQKYKCNYCEEEIGGLRIKCAECTDFDLCLDCFACGAQIAKHKSTHKYMFMNNGGFGIFQNPNSVSNLGRMAKRASVLKAEEERDKKIWNARDEMRLLDAVEQWGYGNWKEIAHHIETKTPEQTKQEYLRNYIYGVVGRYTWKEELRGYQIDHTQAADRGPLSPTLTGKLPPISLSNQEALLLGYMPHRDDFEDFDKDTEMLVAQIGDRSVEDEELDLALKLSQCDIYERRLREQVRRKRVARDYQLVARFYRENPIVEIGLGAKFSPGKISSQYRALMKGDGPKQAIINAMKSLTQFLTAQEFHNLISNLCIEKELKVRIRELNKYRDHGISKQSDMVPFEQKRFRRLNKNRLKAKAKTNSGTNTPTMNSDFGAFLPKHGDYSLKALTDIDYESKEKADPFRPNFKKRSKKSKWNRKKMKTGRRLLLSQHPGCIVTLADQALEKKYGGLDSSDQDD